MESNLFFIRFSSATAENDQHDAGQCHQHYPKSHIERIAGLRWIRIIGQRICDLNRVSALALNLFNKDVSFGKTLGIACGITAVIALVDYIIGVVNEN